MGRIKIKTVIATSKTNETNVQKKSVALREQREKMNQISVNLGLGFSNSKYFHKLNFYENKTMFKENTRSFKLTGNLRIDRNAIETTIMLFITYKITNLTQKNETKFMTQTLYLEQE